MKTTKILLKGIPASPGVVKGITCVIPDYTQIAKMTDGHILVTAFSTPLLTPAIIKASAMVTDRGGILSHGAIVAREMGIPCVVGTEKATKEIQDNIEVIVDGERGLVYREE